MVLARAPIVALAFALALSACLAAPGGPSEAEHVLGGAFTEAVTDADLRAAGRIAEAEGGEMVILESFPPQFSVQKVGKEACERIRMQLEAKAYVASVRECLPRVISEDADAPTSSSASG